MQKRRYEFRCQYLPCTIERGTVFAGRNGQWAAAAGFGTVIAENDATGIRPHSADENTVSITVLVWSYAAAVYSGTGMYSRTGAGCG